MRNLRPLRPLPPIRQDEGRRQRGRAVPESETHPTITRIDRREGHRRRHPLHPHGRDRPLPQPQQRRRRQRQQQRQTTPRPRSLPGGRRSHTREGAGTRHTGGGRTRQRERRLVRTSREGLRRRAPLVRRDAPRGGGGGHAARAGGRRHHVPGGSREQRGRHGAHEAQDEESSGEEDITRWLPPELGECEGLRGIVRPPRARAAFGLRRYPAYRADTREGGEERQGCRTGDILRGGDRYHGFSLPNRRQPALGR
mmetsp:Transcript_3433/g.8719  ORF Transcript_3433/g.8719 Transcript_3433/m.8719 type:complete len:254 (+) Transcript_3433:541-1302(+)